MRDFAKDAAAALFFLAAASFLGFWLVEEVMGVAKSWKVLLDIPDF